jgi:hypothetical protein
VQIRNPGGLPVTMTGWTLRDITNHVYTFPPFTLAAGASVRVWTNSGKDTSTNLYWGSSAAIWNNTGDTAYLRNAQGTLIDEYTYVGQPYPAPGVREYQTLNHDGRGAHTPAMGKRNAPTIMIGGCAVGGGSLSLKRWSGVYALPITTLGVGYRAVWLMLGGQPFTL